MEKEKSYVDEYIDLIIDIERQGKEVDDLDEKELEYFQSVREKAYETIRPEGREIRLLIKIRKYTKIINTLTEKLGRIFNEK